MTGLVRALRNVMPGRIVRSLRASRTFVAFADANGLVAIGPRQPDDEGNTVRGFTAHVGAHDSNVAVGTVAGYDMTVTRRTAIHARLPHERHPHDHTWLIAAVSLDGATLPPTLVLSHAHARTIEEASHVHRHHERHVAVDHRIDATFLIYSETSDRERTAALFTDDVIALLLEHADYDYEITADALYVYDATAAVTNEALTRLLRTAIRLGEAVVGP